jgi:peptidoglycan hydrolase-like protein with peptidoglycan-binding domain
LAVRTIEFLIKENKFPAELGPALISVSLSDTDPEVAQAAAEILPQAYKANPELEKSAIVETQRVLKNGGYYTGELDGQNGESTREALRKFQQEHGIKADGAMQPATMQKLRDLKQKRPGDAAAPQNQPAPSGGSDTRRPTLRGRR